MNLQSNQAAFSAKKVFKKSLAFALAIAAPFAGFCQGPGGPGDGGGSPDPAVPFDDNMNLLFLAMGVVFAVVVTVRYFNKKAVKA